MKKEMWKEIFNGYYAISNQGRLKRLKPGQATYANKILKQGLNSGGYVQYRLQAGNAIKCILAHRLVADAFIGPCPKGHQINHRNGIKTDNRVENLEWVTPSYNTKHAYSLGLIRKRSGEDCYLSKFKNEQILEIRELYAEGMKQCKIAERFDVDKSHIGYIVNRKIWKHLPASQDSVRRRL